MSKSPPIGKPVRFKWDFGDDFWLVAAVVLAVACHSDKRQALLVVEVTKTVDVGPIEQIKVVAAGSTTSWSGDVPANLGVYLPGGFSGSVEAAVSGVEGSVVVAEGRGSATVAPGATSRVSILLMRATAGDGGIDAADSAPEPVDSRSGERDAPADDQPVDGAIEPAKDTPIDLAVDPVVDRAVDPGYDRATIPGCLYSDGVTPCYTTYCVSTSGSVYDTICTSKCSAGVCMGDPLSCVYCPLPVRLCDEATGMCK